ncbi:MAG: hypothetical protein RBT46_03780 [Weeksellaceae bacterium]|jgi:Spy/CpxP family protein refolding chaperone|nr:hypothetical protein [Weeksellaceae bacterium]MDX9704811.1 hypothetical protein [Weeksellaceae bacterium]
MRNILFLAAVLAFVGFSNAQQKTDSKLHTTEVVTNFDRWSAELELTADQIAQIEAINEKAKEEAIAIRSKATNKDLKEINDRKEKSIQAVLTPKQLEKVKKINERRDQEKVEKASLRSNN